MPRPGVSDAVQIEGFADLRKNLNKLEKLMCGPGGKLAKQLNADVKRSLEREVLPDARRLTPQKTGKLAASERVGSRGAVLTLRSPRVYANVQHWGGRTRKPVSGPPTQQPIKGTRFFTRALVGNARGLEVGIKRAVDEYLRRTFS
jgi:hypothetical protein